MDTPPVLIRINNTNVMAVHGDLTRQPVAGVVNAANEYLQHGGGVAQAIVRTGGRVIQEESDAWVRQNGLVGRGQAAVTTGGMLVASHVILSTTTDRTTPPYWPMRPGQPSMRPRPTLSPQSPFRRYPPASTDTRPKRQPRSS